MIASTQPPKKPATMPIVVPIGDREQGGEEGDQQRDPGAVDDPAEDVAAVHRLDPERVVPAHPAELAERAEGAAGGVDQVLVELVRRIPDQP